MNTTFSTVLGLMLKDIYNLKKSLKIFIIFILFYGGFALLSQQSSLVVALMTTISIMLPVSAFSYDHACHWTDYALTLPVSRRQMITARYAFSCISAVGCHLILIPVLFIASRMGSDDAMETMAAIPVTLGVIFLILAVSNGAIYRFGPERGRFVLFAVCMIPVAVALTASRILPLSVFQSIRQWFVTQTFFGSMSLTTALLLGSALTVAVGLIALVISWRMSCRLMERQEF